jgi:deoxyribodipyrimidine photo-lyase
MSTAIWWIRRDLRLHDNAALHAALDGGRRVVPAFILDERLLAVPAGSPRRNAFLFQGLAALDASLRERGSRLVVRRGDPAIELRRLVQEARAEAIVAHVDHSPFSRRRDARVAADLPLTWVGGVTIQPPELVLRRDGSPYTVFGAFRRAWRALPPPSSGGLLPAPAILPPPPAVNGLPLDPGRASDEFPAGEGEALRRLEAFLAEPARRYDEGRNRLDLTGTSALSPYFRFGMISPRLAFARASAELDSAAPEARRSLQTWIDELIWREFFIAILHRFPQVLHTAFRPALRDIRWRDDPQAFDAWTSGRTGYPIVDAAMRQLARTGWMPNRARMITASFLTKDLLVDWRRGERWFMHHLIDGDPAANNGGWQWTAGVGTDAAPYFRIFNPIRQAARFDPRGAYVRRWVPELEGVPDEHIHEPWRMASSDQARLGCRIGPDYPAPIVDHMAQRAYVLAAYRAALRPAS